MKILMQVLDPEFLVVTRKLQMWVLLIAQHPQLVSVSTFQRFHILGMKLQEPQSVPLDATCTAITAHGHLSGTTPKEQPLLPADTENSPVLFTSVAGSLFLQFLTGNSLTLNTALAFFSFLCNQEAILTTKRTTNSFVGRPGRLKSKSNVSSHVADPCLVSCLQQSIIN